MGYTAAPLERLIEEFSKFKGIGAKNATRMAYQVMSMTDEEAQKLAEAIQGAHTRIHRCRICQNYTEADVCPICSSAKRDDSVICVVEKPRDVQVFERTREYNGLYHVLHGLMDPINGVTAEHICVKELLARLHGDKVKEVIMAMNPTVEGEATAMYLAKLIKPLGIKTTRLAQGLPVGGNLEYVDENTLYRALSDRAEL
ncbi:MULTISPECIES: recombination mediator RecR [Faecalibacterium]|jgi:recombination protein RecR|uniref:Recombination protein RecR n=1 Tax=Faecalibacterium langellae TaxID=3435293 RepID=A0ACC9CYD4_9FIRM|nr:recombination mediator RecR [Faecalibacterium prausnitzii]MDU8689776.1 recombination mediator RecR [Faecalibacterium prausnitzii]PDX60814.1 recombination protein RecR [Faecalibacterium prausnitzii]HAQ96902.1 recombination protein RecR [Faecalibacterium sp.]